MSQFDGRAPVAGDPELTAARVAGPGDAAEAFLGTAGAAFTVNFVAAPVLAAAVPVVLAIPVGVPGGLISTLTASFALRPA